MLHDALCNNVSKNIVANVYIHSLKKLFPIPTQNIIQDFIIVALPPIKLFLGNNISIFQIILKNNRIKDRTVLTTRLWRTFKYFPYSIIFRCQHKVQRITRRIKSPKLNPLIPPTLNKAFIKLSVNRSGII